MSNFKATNKSEAGRKLALIKEEIVSTSSKFNRMDLVPLLLCLEDAINNFEITFLKSFMTHKKREKNEKLFLSMSQFVTEWYQSINESLIEISDNGVHLPPKITKLPQFILGVCIQQDIDDYLMRLYKQGQLDKEDLVIRKPRLFLNRIPGWFFIAVRGSNDKSIEDCIAGILEMRDLFYKKGLLETMLYISPEGTTVEFDDATGMRKITLPIGATVESVLEQEGITPRLIETYTRVFDWNSYFREIAAESLKSVKSGKSEKNLARLKKEDQEIYKAYNCMKDYPETFKELYGIELEAFFNIISEITYLCYNNIHTLGWWKYPDLLREQKLSRFSPEDVRRTIQLLSDPAKSKNRYDGFIILDDYVLTSFRRSISRTILLEKCFGEVFNNDLKGKAFEEACRRVLRDGGLKILPGRVEIAEPTVLPEIAFLLWGKQKQRTDIDVVSSQNNSILIIECKEIKSFDLKPRQQKQFKKYLIEHFHKTNWILHNFKKFESYAGTDLRNALSIDERKPVHLFPLLVANLLVTVEGIIETPLITYLELKDIVSSRDLRVRSDDDASGVLEFEIGTRKIKLPWLSAVISER